MNNEKIKRGLEALAGDVPSLPAKASSPALFIIHHSLSIIHYPFYENQIARTRGFSR